MQNKKLNDHMLASNKSISHKFAETRAILARLRKNSGYVDSSSSSEDFDQVLDGLAKFP